MNSTLEKILAIVSIIFAIALVVFIFYFLKKYFFNNNAEQGDNNQVTTTLSPITPTTAKITPSEALTPTPTLPPVDPKAETFEMPRVKGLTVEDAVKLIHIYSEEVTIDWSTEEYSDMYKKGEIAEQYPAETVIIPKDGNIKLTVSAGKELVQLSDVKKQDFETAKTYLTTLGFKVIALHEFSNEVEQGRVIRTEPEGPSLVEKDSEITVYVSDGPETVTVKVPSLKGKTVEQAASDLAALGLSLGSPSYEHSSKAEGTIISQSVSKGTEVESGTSIDYTVSLGPEEEPEPTAPVNVPDDNDDDTSGQDDGGDQGGEPVG